MKYYVTTQGDMWDSIAQDQMGSTDHTGLLMRANMRYALLGTYLFFERPERKQDVPTIAVLVLPQKHRFD